MDKIFIAIHEDTAGVGDTLKDAYDELNGLVRDVPQDEISYYKAERIKVEHRLVEIE